jgi:beta-glucosidase
VRCDVTNTGSRPGAEVVQLYVHDGHASVLRPAKELKAFSKVLLAPGETKTVVLKLDPRSFAFYAPEKHGWSVEAGDYGLLVGSSSRDIRLTGTFPVASPAMAN